MSQEITRWRQTNKEQTGISRRQPAERMGVTSGKLFHPLCLASTQVYHPVDFDTDLLMVNQVHQLGSLARLIMGAMPGAAVINAEITRNQTQSVHFFVSAGFVRDRRKFA